MKTVAVLGGGPGGAFAAERLASAGMRAVLFDEKLAWEKPCGGGLTFKAYQQYPFLMNSDAPKKLIHETVIGATKAGEAREIGQSDVGRNGQEQNESLDPPFARNVTNAKIDRIGGRLETDLATGDFESAGRMASKPCKRACQFFTP